MEREYTSPRDFCLPLAMPEPPHRIPPRDEDNAARTRNPAATHPATEPCREWALASRASIAAPPAAAPPCKDAAVRAALPRLDLLPRCVRRTSPRYARQLAPQLPGRA